MSEKETDLKCCGCRKALPKETYSTVTKRATWFGIHRHNVILDWVCVDCWDKGIRYKGYKGYAEMPH